MNNNVNKKKGLTMNDIIKAIKRNRKIVLLVVAILLLLIIFKTAIGGTSKKKQAAQTKADISEVLKQKQTKIIYIGSSDTKKCKTCNDVKNYLNKEGIEYIDYDVENYSEKEYKEMLKSIDINPDDFGYPGVVYIREGKLYSNVININDTKSVEIFIKDYGLKALNK